MLKILPDCQSFQLWDLSMVLSPLMVSDQHVAIHLDSQLILVHQNQR